jgi:cell division protein ZapA
VSEDEQEKVLKAAEDINNAIKLLQDNYAVKDMQDLLAMTALQLASKSDGKKATETTNSNELDDIQKKLEDLLNDLDA